MELVLTYVLILALFASVPIIIDIVFAYVSANRTKNLLIEKASLDKLELAELKEFIKDSGKTPPGIPGLARSTMALTVIIVLGMAVFHIVVEGVAGDKSPEVNSQIINNVLSMLAGLLAAITGFYFGGKTVEKKVEKNS